MNWRSYGVTSIELIISHDGTQINRDYLDSAKQGHIDLGEVLFQIPTNQLVRQVVQTIRGKPEK